MQPKMFGPAGDRKAVAEARQLARVRANIDQGISQGRSDVLRLGPGGPPLTDGRGRVKPHGVAYQDIQQEMGKDTSLNPWIRGSREQGNRMFAKRRSGKEELVARLSNGTWTPTKAGGSYFGTFRARYTLHVPVWRNTRTARRDNRGRWLDPLSDGWERIPDTLPIPEVLMFDRPGGEKARNQWWDMSELEIGREERAWACSGR